MKRIQLIKYLENMGWILYREEKKHSIYHNPKTNRASSIPRHQEVNNILAKKICRDLDISGI